MNEDTRPLMVTIRCTTYNHEPYIRQCLEGFVMQKTNFRFEAIVHDDASTDGTAAIVREFAEKYPDIIKPIFETENQYSKHDGSLRRIMDEHTHGKYVALCEGDDYWIDPLKLQKQVDFLEANPGYTMCFHNAIEHFENEEKKDCHFSDVKNRDYHDVEIFRQWTIPTASVMFVRMIYTTALYEAYIDNKKIIFGDLPLFLTCCHYGKIRGNSDVMSVYRRHNGGLTAIKDETQSLKLVEFYREIPIIFGGHLKDASDDASIRCFIGMTKRCIMAKKMTKAYLKECFSISIWRTIIILPQTLWNDLFNGHLKEFMKTLLHQY